MDNTEASIALHRQHKGKIEIGVKTPAQSKQDLAQIYTPGVGAVCKAIATDTERVWELTSRGNWVAVITDGSAILGLGNIGTEAGMPVMEGKAVLFKQLAGVDAFPIGLATQDPDEIIETIKRIAPSFGGINLEDIAAPSCFYIEERLKKELNIPVFHDDQHGTAIVTLAGLMNACKVTGKTLEALRIVIAGAGAAGIAIARLLHAAGVKNIILVDSKGIVSMDRGDLNEVKKSVLEITNMENKKGGLAEALDGADVFIGVSGPETVTQDMVRKMNREAIVFAMANPTPEIMPEEARVAGARVVATGRSDFPNQINNALVFPGLFRGLLDMRGAQVTDVMKIHVAQAIADLVKDPTESCIIPELLDERVVPTVAKAVKEVAIQG